MFPRFPVGAVGAVRSAADMAFDPDAQFVAGPAANGTVIADGIAGTISGEVCCRGTVQPVLAEIVVDGSGAVEGKVIVVVAGASRVAKAGDAEVVEGEG